MEKNWKYIQTNDIETVQRLKEELNIDRTLAELLVQRGITSFQAAKLFFRPQLDDLHNPFLMKDMDKAVKRIVQAIENKEKILVYGDYDVDGTTSVSMVYSFLEQIEQPVDYYIPDRYTEGYGISFKGVDYAAAQGIKLVIALDCGIKAVEKIEYANKKGIDFIICDHHTPGEKLPDAVAVLDPKRSDCAYPYKELSGCGVGFKLLQAFCLKNAIQFKELQPFLDLVAVSTASDIVPLTGENRVLAFFGLKQLNQDPRPGLKALRDIAGVVDKNMNIADVVFKIGPRINAAGRIKTGTEAVELLITQDPEKAKKLSEKINEFNQQRKKIDEDITKEALEIIEADDALISQKTTVLYKEGWHKGVIGIVASRLIETYYRPTIIFTQSNGKATGSARSVVGFDLYNAIDACGDILESYGGHKYAAGLTVKEENMTRFQERFEEYVSKNILPEQLIPVIEIDSKINFRSITSKFFRILRQLAPFGPQNMVPVFLTENVKDAGESRVVGATREHLKLDMIDPSGKRMQGIAFFQAHHINMIITGRPFNICYSIAENEHNGKTSLQLIVKDIKF